MKSLIAKIPYFPGRLLAYIPFDWKLGRRYSYFKDLAARPSPSSDELLIKLNSVYSYAKTTLSWYNEFYKDCVTEIQTLADWESLPLLTKRMRESFLGDQSQSSVVTTGGTTGSPLALYHDKDTLQRNGPLCTIYGKPVVIDRNAFC